MGLKTHFVTCILLFFKSIEANWPPSRSNGGYFKRNLLNDYVRGPRARYNRPANLLEAVQRTLLGGINLVNRLNSKTYNTACKDACIPQLNDFLFQVETFETMVKLHVELTTQTTTTTAEPCNTIPYTPTTTQTSTTTTPPTTTSTTTTTTTPEPTTTSTTTTTPEPTTSTTSTTVLPSTTSITTTLPPSTTSTVSPPLFTGYTIMDIPLSTDTTTQQVPSQPDIPSTISVTSTTTLPPPTSSSTTTPEPTTTSTPPAPTTTPEPTTTSIITTTEPPTTATTNTPEPPTTATTSSTPPPTSESTTTPPPPTTTPAPTTTTYLIYTTRMEPQLPPWEIRYPGEENAFNVCLGYKTCNPTDQECLKNCVNHWYQYCSTGTYNCFYDIREVSESPFSTREQCLSECRVRTPPLAQWIEETEKVTRVSNMTVVKEVDSFGLWNTDYIVDFVKARCVGSYYCPEGNWDCYEACANEFHMGCRTDPDFSCFYDDMSYRKSSHEDRDTCIQECYESPTKQNVRDGLRRVQQRYMDTWDRDTAVEFLKDRCVDEQICPDGNTPCYQACEAEWNRSCEKGIKFACYFEEVVATGYTERDHCFNDCQSSTILLRDGLERVMSKFMPPGTYSNFWTDYVPIEIPDFDENGYWSLPYMTEYLHDRCVSSKVCLVHDHHADFNHCLDKCTKQYRAYCYNNQNFKCFNEDNDLGGFPSRVDCIDECESRSLALRVGLEEVSFQYFSQPHKIELRTDFVQTEVPDFDKFGVWSVPYIVNHVKDRCIATNVCPTDARPDIVTLCLEACAQEWARECNKGKYKCFMNEPEFGGFASRSECKDECKTYNKNVRDGLTRVNRRYNKENPVNFSTTFEESEDETPAMDQVSTERKSIMIDGRLNEWERTIRNGQPEEWRRLHGKDPMPGQEEENVEVPVDLETKSYNFEGEENTWQREVEDGVPGEWTHVSGPSPRNPDEQEAYEAEIEEQKQELLDKNAETESIKLKIAGEDNIWMRDVIDAENKVYGDWVRINGTNPMTPEEFYGVHLPEAIAAGSPMV